jgi:transcriptional regulator with GAF, ATPase, and Fis domain
VRELKKVISRATLGESIEHFQRRCAEHALAESGGVWSWAASALGMHRANFHRLAKRMRMGMGMGMGMGIDDALGACRG